MTEPTSAPPGVLRRLLEQLKSNKRYDLITNYRCGSSIEEMERADDGEWIRFEDVEAALAAVGRTPEEPEKR